jgi:hypothetical protein
MTKIAGSGSESGSGSISQRHGSADPDPDPPQNVMDPQHCKKAYRTHRANMVGAATKNMKMENQTVANTTSGG